MNRPRIKSLIRALRAQKYPKGLGFSMASFYSPTTVLQPKFHPTDAHPCNTVCCIAGLSVAKFKPDQFGRNFVTEIPDLAREILDLDHDTGHALFCPAISVRWADISPSSAAMVLENFLKTNKIDWTIIPEFGADAHAYV